MIYDVAIIGAGMAGASLAAQLDPGLSVVLLEAEERPGTHATGRSAAFYTETYGGPDVQPLTTASKDWYFNTQSVSSGALMVTRRGALHVNWREPQAKTVQFHASLKALSPDLSIQTPDACHEICSAVPRAHIKSGVYDPDCCDIDVASVHDHFLRQSKQRGVALMCHFAVSSAKRMSGVWVISSRSRQTIRAKTLVNAAGAWADQVAMIAGAAPLGLSPKRRTVGVFDLEDGQVDSKWPLVLDLGDSFYFKPEGPQLLISPADETPSAACDAQPEVEDIALAAHRFEMATGRKLGQCRAKWAGLRTFAPDRSPVYGYDSEIADFFWCAGQGGFGIQTAPAAGALGAALLQRNTLPQSLRVCGITSERYAPQRFLRAA